MDISSSRSLSYENWPDTLTGGDAKLLADADVAFGAFEVKVTFPAHSSTARAIHQLIVGWELTGHSAF